MWTGKTVAAAAAEEEEEDVDFISVGSLLCYNTLPCL